MPKAFTLTRTSVSLGAGVGISAMNRFPGGPDPPLMSGHEVSEHDTSPQSSVKHDIPTAFMADSVTIDSLEVCTRIGLGKGSL